MTARGTLLLLCALAGCRSPSYVSGNSRCAPSGQRCPQDFYCAADDRCWKNGDAPDLAAAGDLGAGDLFIGDQAGDFAAVDFASAMPDAAGDDAAVDGGCGWPFGVTNVDPCSISVQATDWTLSSDYDTTAGASGSGAIGTLVSQSNGTMVRVVRVTNFSVPAAASVTISGNYPLLVLADTATVDGTVAIAAGRNAAGCAVVNGSGATYCGAGGAGGSFGALGGKGGGCEGAGITNGSTAGNGNAILSPLRGGCLGGLGGNGGDATRGYEGVSGGALQISGRMSITVAGVLSAHGFGGGGGNGTQGGCAGGTDCSAGGGGGGSGGAILLEAPSISVTGKLCANGGGGGEGGGIGLGGAGAGGGSGTCADGASSGGGGTTNGGNGSGGGHASHPTGYDGNGVVDNNGGGGGGGSVGRIRVRSGVPSWKAGAAVVTPNAYEN